MQTDSVIVVKLRLRNYIYQKEMGACQQRMTEFGHNVFRFMGCERCRNIRSAKVTEMNVVAVQKPVDAVNPPVVPDMKEMRAGSPSSSMLKA